MEISYPGSLSSHRCSLHRLSMKRTAEKKLENEKWLKCEIQFLRSSAKCCCWLLWKPAMKGCVVWIALEFNFAHHMCLIDDKHPVSFLHHSRISSQCGPSLLWWMLLFSRYILSCYFSWLEKHFRCNVGGFVLYGNIRMSGAHSRRPQEYETQQQ